MGFIDIRSRSVAPVVMVVAALAVLTGTLIFGSLRPDYSPISNTISELGETGAEGARVVAFGFFLPVGLLVWLALWLAHRVAHDKQASVALAVLSCLGFGYVIAALFPCDPGAPFFGSWRTQIHNVAGFIDYEGTGFGFLLVARCLAKRKRPVHAIGFLAAGLVMLLCLALLCIQAAFPIRGAIQRFAEVIQFVGTASACSWLPKEITDDDRTSRARTGEQRKRSTPGG